MVIKTLGYFIRSMKSKKDTPSYRIDCLLLILLIALPLTLLSLPASFFDTGKSICIITNFTGQSCPGCGLTRAIMHLIHLDFETAFAYNMLSFIILPIILFLWISKIRLYIKRVFNNKQPSKM